MNNRGREQRPGRDASSAVDELRSDEPLLDHHIEELLDAINALQARIAPPPSGDSPL